uniref:C2H2-type domain-containing protein n=1 Tax=Photinus pyralis TaxID=7054 RepID=A0A1Y1L165_PHOPY
MSVDEVIPFVKIESNLEDNPLEEILFLNQTTTAIKEEPNDNTSCADYDELEIDFHEEDPLKLDSSVRSAEELIENERSAHTQPADNLTSLSTVAQKGGDCPCPEQTSTQEQTTNFRCYDCNYTTNNRNLSMEHLLQHENYAYFTCHMCNFATNDCTYLEAHVLLHAPRVVNSAVNYLVCDFPMLNRAEEIKTKKCPSQMVCDNPKSNKDTNLKKHTPTRRKEESKCKRGGTRTGCRNTKVKKSREKSIDIKKHISGYLEKKYKHNKCDLPTIYKDTKANNNDEDDLQMIIKSRFKEHVLTYTRRKPQIKSQEENTTKEIIKPHEQGIKLTNKVIENEICDHHAGDLPKSMSTFENKGNNCCRPEGTTTEGSAYSTPKVSVVHENEICSLQETSAQEQKNRLQMFPLQLYNN